MKLRPALAALLVTLAALLAPPAHAARPDAYPLHVGSSGSRVDGLKWLLAGHRPNVFNQVKGTFHGKAAGVFDRKTAAALIAYRYRLGYPAKGQCGARSSKLVDTVGPQFFAILEGKKTRPVCWVALAASRIKLAAQTEPTPLALRVIAWELQQVGTHETCGGSCNRGALKGPGGWSVDAIEEHFHLVGLAWCQIFQELGFEIGGYRPIPFSPFPWSVIPTYRWAAEHNLASAKIQVGSEMDYLGDAGHTGLVYRIQADSAGHVKSYDTVEGNCGDAVCLRHYVFGDRLRVFINYPGMTR